MGGVFKGGGGSAPAAPAAPAAPKVVEAAAAPATKPTAVQEQEGARVRGARRRGRQLLSDARLNAQAGVETLGSGQTL